MLQVYGMPKVDTLKTSQSEHDGNSYNLSYWINLRQASTQSMCVSWQEAMVYS